MAAAGLRDYQAQAIREVYAAWRAGTRSVLLSMPTGSGKTHTSAHVIRDAVGAGNRVAFVTHLTELIDDTSTRLGAAGVAHGVIQADRRRAPEAPVQVCSVATLARRGERPEADLLVLDECHRSTSSTWRSVLDAYPDARVLGLSATPARADDTPLGDVFDVLVCGPSVARLTAEGSLVPVVVLSPPTLADGALAEDPASALAHYAPGRRSLVFCSTVDQATDVAARIPGAELLLGETPRAQRATVRARLQSGELRAVVACSAPIEGFDAVALDCVVLARAFSTMTSYLQGVGRGMRPCPETGKRDCLVVDLVGAALLHGLPEDERVWSLTGAACRRTAEALAPLARCKACLAVFHAGPAACPRCGMSTRGAKVKRRATRVERQELARLDDRPQAVRDEIALRAIAERIRRRQPDWSEAKIARCARFALEKNRRRPAA